MTTRDRLAEWMRDQRVLFGTRFLCSVGVHDVQDDNCLKPEHRYCPRCGKDMPHARLGHGFRRGAPG
jgi:hypothetical protein